jgi:hypothetical protein
MDEDMILLDLIEVQTGSYFAVDDFIRIEDDFRRSWSKQSSLKPKQLSSRIFFPFAPRDVPVAIETGEQRYIWLPELRAENGLTRSIGRLLPETRRRQGPDTS